MGITVRSFEQMQRRIGGGGRSRKPAEAAPISSTPSSAESVILGIDPSLRGTGYGILQFRGASARVLAQGTITCSAHWARTQCLAAIARALRELIHEHHPVIGVVEGLFYAQNLKTALIMGEARGAALVAAAEAGLEVCEMAPRKVKQAIAGYGAAHKLTVARMVQRMLSLADTPAPDAADALALALAFAQERRSGMLRLPKRL